VAETVPGCRIEYAAGGGPDRRCYRVSCEKIKTHVPAFQPKWTAQQGARELYEAYKVMGLTKKDLEQGKYVRMAQIQRLLDAGFIDNSLRWTMPQDGNTFPSAVSRA